MDRRFAFGLENFEWVVSRALWVRLARFLRGEDAKRHFDRGVLFLNWFAHDFLLGYLF